MLCNTSANDFHSNVMVVGICDPKAAACMAGCDARKSEGGLRENKYVGQGRSVPESLELCFDMLRHCELLSMRHGPGSDWPFGHDQEDTRDSLDGRL